MRTRATNEEVIAYLLAKYKVDERELDDIRAAILDEDSEALAIVCDWLNVNNGELRDARQAT